MPKIDLVSCLADKKERKQSSTKQSRVWSIFLWAAHGARRQILFVGVLSVSFLAEPKTNTVVRDQMLSAVDGPWRATADVVGGRVVTTLDIATRMKRIS